MNQEVWIPFNAWSKKRLREKKKTSTARSRPYGIVGDWFVDEGVKYVFDAITFVSFDDIVNVHYKSEGANTKQELLSVFRQIFRGKPFPQGLYLHFFHEETVKGGDGG